MLAACSSISVRAFDFEPRLSDYSRPPCVVTGPEWPEAEIAVRKKLEAALGQITFRTPHTTDTDEAFRQAPPHEGVRVPGVVTFIGHHNGYVIVERGTTTSWFCIEVVDMVGGPILKPHLFSTTEP
jgi:hypothetical protein